MNNILTDFVSHKVPKVMKARELTSVIWLFRKRVVGRSCVGCDEVTVFFFGARLAKVKARRKKVTLWHPP